MDVGAPSNFERLRWTLPHEDELRAALQAHSVDDSTIRATIAQHADHGDELFCPHTATAMHLLDLEPADGEPWIVVATAHPAKFETVLQPLLGYAPPIPAALNAMLQRSASAEPLAASETALREWLLGSSQTLPLRREKASAA
jgi:threonine synthase